MVDVSLIVDLTALAMIVVCLIVYCKKGFLVSLIDVIGTASALVLAVLLASGLAPILFNALFRAPMETQMATAIQEQGVGQLTGIVGKLLFFLPSLVVETLMAPFDAALETNATAIAVRLVAEIIAPLIIPVIMVSLFVVLFVAVTLLLHLFIKKLRKASEKMSVASAVDKALGLALGAVLGVVYAFALGVCLWAFRLAVGDLVLETFTYDKSILFNFIISLPWFSV